MFKILIEKTYIPVIFICLVSFIISWAFGITNHMIQTETHNGIEILTFDFRTYLANMSNAWSTLALNFEDILPPRQWEDIGIFTFNEAIVNNIAYVFDWIYFPLNFILYIIRWFSWLINLGLALIGWPQEGSILVDTLKWITQNLVIPYV